METISTKVTELKPTPEMIAKMKQITDQKDKATKPVQTIPDKTMKLIYERIEHERKLKEEQEARLKKSQERLNFLESALRDNPDKLNWMDKEEKKLDVLLTARAKIIADLKEINPKVKAQQQRVAKFHDASTKRVMLIAHGAE